MSLSGIGMGRWITVLLAFFSSLSHGHSENPMTFLAFWPCAGMSGPLCAPRILADGIIQGNSATKLSEFLSNSQLHSVTLPPKPVVCFNSAGGDVAGAIELGRLIYSRGLDTCLAPS